MKKILALCTMMLLCASFVSAQTYSPTYSTKIIFKNGSNLLTLIPTGLSESFTLKLPTGDGLTGQVLGLVGAADQLGWITPIADGGAAGGDLAGTYPDPTIATNAGPNIVAALNSSGVTNSLNADVLKYNATLAVSSNNLGINVGNANNWTNTQTFPTTAAQGNALISSVNSGATTIDNARTTATNAATASTIVSRDASKGFSAGRIVIVDQNEFRVNDADNSDYVGFKAATATTAYTMTFPADDGAADQVLKTDGTGILSWASPSSTSWALGGNTSPSSNILGTISATDVDMRAGNVTQMTLRSAGGIDIPATTNAGVGIILQGGVKFIHSYGSDNFFAGRNAGNLSMTGGSNTATGANTFNLNTTGEGNAAYGPGALYSNTTGSSNTAMGMNSLSANGEGYNNTGVGFGSLFFNSSGLYNSALGTSTGGTNTIGSYNTFVGALSDASANNLTNATAIGYGAVVNASNKIQLGSSIVTRVSTHGNLSIRNLDYVWPAAFAVGVLTSDVSGNLSWTPAAAPAWSLTGNAGTTAGTNYVGTSDSKALHIYVNGGTSNSLILNTNGSIQRDNAGNARGAYAVDLQITRGNVAQVAAGTNSVIGGGSSNTALVNYTTIAGGNGNLASENSATIGGGSYNTAGGDYSFVGGGRRNIASGRGSVVSGGGWNGVDTNGNTASGDASSVGGGYGNTAGSSYSTVAGGDRNTASAPLAFIGGGTNNVASGGASTIGGGGLNTASANNATIAGGAYNRADATNSAIPGGRGLSIQSTATGTFGFLGGNTGLNDMWIATANTAVFGNTNLWLANNNGSPSELRFYDGADDPGLFPEVAKHVAFKSAPALTATQTYTLPLDYPTTTGQVLASTTTGDMSWTSPSSTSWSLTGNAGTTAGTNYVGTTDEEALHLYVEGGTTNALVLNTNGSIQHSTTGNTRGIGAIDLQRANGDVAQVANGDYATISGGSYNTASGIGSVVGGGGFDGTIGGNTASGNASTVGGGYGNNAATQYSTIAGGRGNSVTENTGTIGGGFGNTATGDYTFIGGGKGNTASGRGSAVVGGGWDGVPENEQPNNAGGDASFIGGGSFNIANGDYSVIAGGRQHAADGNFSFVGSGLWNTSSGDFVSIGGGITNVAAGMLTAIPGGRGLRLNGVASFGFNGVTGSDHDMIIDDTTTAVFSNTDLWLANNTNAASELRFYEANATPFGAFPPAAINYTAFKAGAQTANLTYTLPLAYPTLGGQVLASTTTGGMSWATAITSGGAAGGDLAGTYPDPTIASTAGTNIVTAINDGSTSGTINTNKLDGAVVLDADSPTPGDVSGSYLGGFSVNSVQSVAGASIVNAINDGSGIIQADNLPSGIVYEIDFPAMGDVGGSYLGGFSVNSVQSVAGLSIISAINGSPGIIEADNLPSGVVYKIDFPTPGDVGGSYLSGFSVNSVQSVAGLSIVSAINGSPGIIEADNLPSGVVYKIDSPTPGDVSGSYLSGFLVNSVQSVAGASVVTAINGSSSTIDAERIGNGLTNSQVDNDLTINGGSVDASPIGLSSASTAVFTTAETGTLKVTGGTPAMGKVLTSDVDGNATWQNPGQSLVYGEAVTSALGAVNVGDYDLTLASTNASKTYFPISSAADIDVRGIIAGSAGRFITLVNVGSFTITLKDDNGVAAANSIHVVGAGNDLPVGPEGVVHLIYTSTGFWRVVGVF